MLKSMRKHAKYFYVLFFIVIASFVLWGTWTNKGDERGAEMVAEIGSTKITLNQFLATYRRAADNLRDMYGSKFDDNVAKALKKSILDEMVTDEVLAQAAQKEGVSVSNQELSEAITSDPRFIQDGVFSRNVYETILRNNGISAGDYESMMKRQLLVQKMRRLVMNSITLSPAELQGFPKTDAKTASIVQNAMLESKQDRAFKSYVEGLERGMNIVEKPELIS